MTGDMLAIAIAVSAVALVVLSAPVALYLFKKVLLRRAAWRMTIIGGLLVGMFAAYVHIGFPRQHRIYFDEDAYANISKNTLRGRVGCLTLCSTPQVRRAIRYKWPVAFPVLMLPSVMMFGPEDGPAIFNEICGAITVILVMLLAAGLSGNWYAAPVAVGILACQPVAIAWYRSGSSDPLAVLLALAALVGSYGSRRMPTVSYLPAIVLLSAALAVHTRLESVLLIVPVALLLRRPQAYIPSFVAVGASGLAIWLGVYAIRHYSTLDRFYLANLPDSRFSLEFTVINFQNNLRFLTRDTPLTGSLIFFSIAGLFLMRKEKLSAAILMSYPVMVSILLLFYSVGQYQSPGETRFLLLTVVVGSALLAGELAQVLPLKSCIYLCVGLLILVAVSKRESEQLTLRMTRELSSIRQEHDVIRLWASELPTGATVVSRLPYIWDNFGVYSTLPDDQTATDLQAPLYFHFGLVNGSQEWPPGAVPIRTITTEHGTICLFRLR